MKLTILGSGTLVPDGARNSSGYFVELPDARIMLDCGAGTLHALARYGLPWQQMSHLFVSHFHLDHIGELASLFFAFKHGVPGTRTEPFTLIGPRNLDRVMDGLAHAFGEKLFQPPFPVDIQMIEPEQALILGGCSRLSVAKTPHTNESLAIRIDSDGRSLCYTGDTGYSEPLAEFCSGVDLLLAECSFAEPRSGSRHLSVAEVAALAARANAARLVVTHFYFEVDEARLRSDLASRYQGEVLIGRDGLAIEV